nr:hypothetical protein Iba_chr11fCG6570 [Ipomoea batatas]
MSTPKSMHSLHSAAFTIVLGYLEFKQLLLVYFILDDNLTFSSYMELSVTKLSSHRRASNSIELPSFHQLLYKFIGY